MTNAILLDARDNVATCSRFKSGGTIGVIRDVSIAKTLRCVRTLSKNFSGGESS